MSHPAKSKLTTPANGISVSQCETLQQLEAISDEIDSLSGNPFLKCSWMIPWIRTYCPDPFGLRFLTVRDQQGSLIGFAPLVLKSSLKQARYLAFVGSGKACADYMTFPVKDGHQQIVLGSIATWLAENSDGWDRIELDGVSAADPVMASFVSMMEACEFGVTTIDTLASFRLQLPDTWEELLALLSRNSRKKYRRLARQHAGNSRLNIARDSESLNEGFRVLEYLHTRRWKSLGEEGCFAQPGFREFLLGVAREKMALGKLSLIWMTWKDTPIAADIAWREGAGLFTFQGGISPDHLDLEPGKAIIKCQIELAMQHGLQFVDFLRGDEPYKSRFFAEPTKNVRYEIAGRSSRARITQTMLRLGRYMSAAMGNYK